MKDENVQRYLDRYMRMEPLGKRLVVEYIEDLEKKVSRNHTLLTAYEHTTKKMLVGRDEQNERIKRLHDELKRDIRTYKGKRVLDTWEVSHFTQVPAWLHGYGGEWTHNPYNRRDVLKLYSLNVVILEVYSGDTALLLEDLSIVTMTQKEMFLRERYSVGVDYGTQPSYEGWYKKYGAVPVERDDI